MAVDAIFYCNRYTTIMAMGVIVNHANVKRLRISVDWGRRRARRLFQTGFFVVVAAGAAKEPGHDWPGSEILPLRIWIEVCPDLERIRVDLER